LGESDKKEVRTWEEKKRKGESVTQQELEGRREGKGKQRKVRACVDLLTLEHVLKHDGSLSNLLVDGEGLLIGGLEGNFGGGHLRRGAKGGGRRRKEKEKEKEKVGRSAFRFRRRRRRRRSEG